MNNKVFFLSKSFVKVSLQLLLGMFVSIFVATQVQALEISFSLDSNKSDKKVALNMPGVASSQEEDDDTDSEVADEKADVAEQSRKSFLPSLFSFDTSGDQAKVAAAISNLEQEVGKKEQVLQQTAQEQLQEIQSKIQKEIAAIKQKAEKLTEELKEGVKEKSQELRHQAAKQALTIISSAEEEALARKKQERMKELQSRFKTAENKEDDEDTTDKVDKPGIVFDKTPLFGKESVGAAGTRITPEWKNALSKRFYADMAYMKKVVLEGESPREAQDFLKYFTEQNMWFDTTLRSTRYIDDQYYSQALKKQQQLEQLITAQKTADNYLKKFVQRLSLDSKQKKKVRLMVLYDLNNFVHKQKKEPSTMASLDDEKVKGIVKKTVEDFSVKFKERSGEFPDVQIVDRKTTQVVSAMAQQLQKELEAAQEELSETKDSLREEKAAKRRLKELAKKRIYETKSNALGLEVELKGVKNELTRVHMLKEQAVKSAELDREAKMELARRLEDADKENLSLQLDVQQAKQNAEVKKYQAVKKVQEKFAQKLKQKEERNLELTVLLQRATDQAEVLKKQAQRFVSDQKMLQKRVELATREVQTAQLDAKKQDTLRAQAESKAKMTEELANETMQAIDKYLSEQKIVLIEMTSKLREEHLNARLEKEIAIRERDEIKARQKLLVKERELLENLKEETKKIVENSAKIDSGNIAELLKFRQDTEAELRKIKLDTERELKFAKEQLEMLSMR